MLLFPSFTQSPCPSSFLPQIRFPPLLPTQGLDGCGNARSLTIKGQRSQCSVILRTQPNGNTRRILFAFLQFLVKYIFIDPLHFFSEVQYLFAYRNIYLGLFIVFPTDVKCLRCHLLTFPIHIDTFARGSLFSHCHTILNCVTL